MSRPGRAPARIAARHSQDLLEGSRLGRYGERLAEHLHLPACGAIPASPGPNSRTTAGSGTKS